MSLVCSRSNYTIINNNIKRKDTCIFFTFDLIFFLLVPLDIVESSFYQDIMSSFGLSEGRVVDGVHVQYCNQTHSGVTCKLVF